MSDRRNTRIGPFRRRRRLRLAPTFGPPELNRSEEAEPPQPVPVPAIENSDKPQLISDRYILLENVEGTKLRKALDIITKKEYSCSVLNRQTGATVLEAHFRLQSSEFVAQPTEIITAGSEEFIFYPKNHGDVHAYVRDHLIRDEDQAQMIIRQIVGAVADCHSAGIVLTDLKMRRFVFANAKKTKVVLETLEDATLLSSVEDVRSYRRIGYPAYMAPEAIFCARGGSFAGRPADVWALGVMIYTVLVGKYPFNDPNPLALFSKIVQGYYQLPDDMSHHAKCLIRNLLLRDPTQRLTAEDILAHPWFADKDDLIGRVKRDNAEGEEETGEDQQVPLFGLGKLRHQVLS